jgi:hypothetical protein
MTPQPPFNAEESPDETLGRKPYTKPRLEVYGDLAHITRGVPGSKTNDGAGHPNRHFTS